MGKPAVGMGFGKWAQAKAASDAAKTSTQTGTALQGGVTSVRGMQKSKSPAPDRTEAMRAAKEAEMFGDLS